MADPVIHCPQCKTEIKLTDAVAAPLLDSARQDFARQLAQKDAAAAEKEKRMREREDAVARAQETVNQRVADQLRTERTKIAAEESAKAKQTAADELSKMQQEKTQAEQLARERGEKLAAAERMELELRKQRQQLQEEKERFDLDKQRAIDAERIKIRESVQKDADEQSRLKIAEKEKTIGDLEQKLAEALRKAQQGSQQTQGEVLELRLEAILREKFPIDRIEPVAKGEFGGDVLQYVIGPAGRVCGVILWETKRTKTWSDGWLPKLRDDQRAAKADLAVIISQALPKNIETFDHIDGIWIADIRCAIPVALALRHGLIETAAARTAADGQQGKMEMVYQYLTGPRFKQRVHAIVEKFTDMQQDLDKERKSMTRLWAKREEQIRGVLEATAGLYGDLQGIAGKSLEEIEGLSMNLLGEGGD